MGNPSVGDDGPNSYGQDSAVRQAVATDKARLGNHQPVLQVILVRGNIGNRKCLGLGTAVDSAIDEVRPARSLKYLPLKKVAVRGCSKRTGAPWAKCSIQRASGNRW